MSTAFVFPGQGSQYVGMGKALFDKYQEAREVFEKANNVLNFDIAKLCFEGPADQLNQTMYTQPALLTVSISILSVLKTHNIAAKVAAGHSLGEYSAIVYAGALSFEDAVRLVHLRGKYMQQQAPPGTGGMAAILGLDGLLVHDLCVQSSKEGHTVEAVNYNCPGQVVIAGTQNGLQRAMELAKEAGARRCVPLAVSGPFHSSFMRPTGEKLADDFNKISFKDLTIPVISNVTADYVHTAQQVKEKLVQQVYSPVRWEESVQRLHGDGYTTYIEVGSGKVLSGLIRKTIKGAVTLNVEDNTSLEKVLAQVREVG